MRSRSRIADELGCAKRERAKLQTQVRERAKDLEAASQKLAALRGQEGKEEEAAAWMRTFSQLSNEHRQLVLELYDANEHQNQLQEEYDSHVS